VRFAADLIRLDVDELERHAASRAWSQAAALVTSEFLEGFSVPGASGFEDWLAAERTFWRRQSVEVLVHHSEELLRTGKAAEAAAVAHRALKLDSRSEHAVRAAIRGLALAGDRAAALDLYDDFGRRLAEELGTKPEPDTATLVERVRRERLTRPAAAAQPTRTADDRIPLVGREAELGRLLEAAAACRANSLASVLVLEGDSGFGKTRLLEELLARLRLDGVAVAAVRAVEGDQAEERSGVLALARSGLLEMPGVVAAPPNALAAFASELPEWAERFPGAVGVGEPLSLARALSEVLRTVGAQQPVALAVDDAQWLDPPSVRVLGAALRDLAPVPLTLVLGIGAPADRDDLDELRSRIGRDLTGVTVRVGALGAPALGALAAGLLPDYDAVALDRVVRRVATDSAGVPLLAVAILRAVALGLDLRGSPGAWPEPFKTLEQSLPGDLPDAVVAAIRMGFRRLSPDGQGALAAASVLGDRVPPDLLGCVLGRPVAQLAPILDELEWHRWLVGEPRGYGFAARIVRAVIARDMLTPGQRARVLAAAEGCRAG